MAPADEDRQLASGSNRVPAGAGAQFASAAVAMSLFSVSVNEPVIQQLVAGRAAIGSGAWLAPRLSGRLFGLDPDARGLAGWDVYDATYEHGHMIVSVGPLTPDHKLDGILYQSS